MPLWGITDESKPKWLTDSEKKESFANTSGWVIEGGSKMTGNGNPDAQAEVLVAIRNLSNRMAEGTITEVEWITTAFSKSAAAASGRTLSVRVRYNEPVTVSGSPTLAVTNAGVGRGPHTLVYASGSNSNELTFTLVIAKDNAATNAGDVLSIGAQNILKPGGATIVDKGTAINSGVAISGSQGTAAGTITVGS